MACGASIASLRPGRLRLARLQELQKVQMTELQRRFGSLLKSFLTGDSRSQSAKHAKRAFAVSRPKPVFLILISGISCGSCGSPPAEDCPSLRRVAVRRRGWRRTAQSFRLHFSQSLRGFFFLILFDRPKAPPGMPRKFAKIIIFGGWDVALKARAAEFADEHYLTNRSLLRRALRTSAA